MLWRRKIKMPKRRCDDLKKSRHVLFLSVGVFKILNIYFFSLNMISIYKMRVWPFCTQWFSLSPRVVMYTYSMATPSLHIKHFTWGFHLRCSLCSFFLPQGGVGARTRARSRARHAFWGFGDWRLRSAEEWSVDRGEIRRLVVRCSSSVRGLGVYKVSALRRLLKTTRSSSRVSPRRIWRSVVFFFCFCWFFSIFFTSLFDPSLWKSRQGSHVFSWFSMTPDGGRGRRVEGCAWGTKEAGLERSWAVTR